MSADPSVPTARRLRDLSVLDLGETSVVVACDSSGGIGPKIADSVAVPASVVAHFAARVALVELFAAGATPVMIVDTLCVEAEPTGAEMITAVRALAAQIGLDAEAAVTGSTEDNVETRATGVGVTAIGVAPRGTLRPGNSRPGDLVVCLGLPLSAPKHRLYPDHPQIVTIDEVRRTAMLKSVHDILPVGSRGIRFELDQLASAAHLRAEIDPACTLDLDCSGGPVCCVLVSCPVEATSALVALRAELPVTRVASLHAVSVA